PKAAEPSELTTSAAAARDAIREREADFVVQRPPVSEGVAEAQGGAIAHVVRSEHNGQRALMPEGESFEQCRHRSWVRCTYRPENRLQKVVRRCRRQQPNPVGLRRDCDRDRVAHR
ncbi:MAG: hypothetical protein J0I07_18830, partial [Myxococcales bacterium]|nr:hypothetical protein [Myxococcales bacterium]